MTALDPGRPAGPSALGEPGPGSGVEAVGDIACAHCGLPVPPALRVPDEPDQFCCQGCRTVFDIIHRSGLEAYYQLRDEAPGQAAPSPDRSFEELDDPAFLERHCRPRGEGELQTELYLEGVHCSACMWLIEKALAREPGVGEARLDFGRARLTLAWRPEIRSLSALARRLAGLGYVPHPARHGSDAHRAETRRLIIRIGVAGAVAGNVMLMAFALYGGWISGMEDAHRRLFRYASLAVSLPSVLYAALPFYRSALNGLRAGVLHMDLPISIGILAGFLGGVVNTLRDRGEIYFDSVCALIFLLLVGRLLQTQQQRRATESSELLFALTPAFARHLGVNGEAKRIPLDAIVPGDRLEVGAGEVIPVDGVVQSGRSAVDMSLLSGESMPVPVGRDDEVWGGTTNLQDDLVVVALKGVRASRVGQIADMVEEASEHKAPVVQLADRIAGWFVAVVLALAGVTFAVWSVLAPGEAIDHAVALLIVSCPCALGLATPLALTAAIGKAARRGVLVRTGAALEALGASRGGRIFFDKTGTLTHGRMEVVRFEGPDWVRPLVAAAERGSTHPVGRALRAHFDVLEEPATARGRAEPATARGRLEATEVEVVPGGGLSAIVEGHRVLVGSPRFVGGQALRDPDLDAKAEGWSEEALTPVWVAVDGRVRAIGGLADRIRSEAKDSVAFLESLGFELTILSGDHPAVVHAVGRQLGIAPDRCWGGLSPEDKLERVRSAGGSGPVVMVGDGVNDAAALAAASVGIAVHGGAETCFAAADVFLQRPGVRPLVDLVDGSRRTYRSIRENIVFSLLYNTVGAGLALTGLLNPLVAAVLMPLSSLVVVTNSFRFRFGPKEETAPSPSDELPAR